MLGDDLDVEDGGDIAHCVHFSYSVWIVKNVWTVEILNTVGTS